MNLLHSMRSRAKGIVAKALIALLVVAMAAFGIDAFFYGSNGNNTVLTINGRSITTREVENAIFVYRQQLSSQFGQEYIDQIQEETITEEALDRLTKEVLLAQQAELYQLTASDDNVQQTLASIPEFRSDSGFNRDAFVNYLQVNDISSGQLRENIRQSIAIQTLPAFISGSSFSTDGENDIIAAVVYESRDIQYARIIYKDFEQMIQPDEDELQQYYEENKDSYQSEEQASFQYLLLDKEKINEQLDPDETEINRAYQEYLAELSEDNRYGVSHILVDMASRDKEDAKTTADKIKALIDSGANFNELVKEYSDDPGSSQKNGSLGLINPDEFLPEFADQIQLISEGDIVGPFLSTFGYHIIRLDETPESNRPELAEVRDSMIARIKSQKSSEMYEQQKIALGNATFSALDLTTPAQELDMQLLESDLVPRSAYKENGKLFANKKLLDAAFDKEVLVDLLNSQVIDIGDKAVVLRLKEHQPQRQLLFNDVADLVRQSFIEKQAQERARELAQNIADKINNDTTLKPADLLADQSFLDGLPSSMGLNTIKLNWSFEKGLTRFTTEASPEIVNLAFSLKNNESLQIQESSGNIYLGLLTASRQPTYDQLEYEQKKSIDQEIQQQMSYQLTNAFYSFLYSQASIKDLTKTETFN